MQGALLLLVRRRIELRDEDLRRLTPPAPGGNHSPRALDFIAERERHLERSGPFTGDGAAVSALAAACAVPAGGAPAGRAHVVFGLVGFLESLSFGGSEERVSGARRCGEVLVLLRGKVAVDNLAVFALHADGARPVPRCGPTARTKELARKGLHAGRRVGLLDWREVTALHGALHLVELHGWDHAGAAVAVEARFLNFLAHRNKLVVRQDRHVGLRGDSAEGRLERLDADALAQQRNVVVAVFADDVVEAVLAELLDLEGGRLGILVRMRRYPLFDADLVDSAGEGVLVGLLDFVHGLEKGGVERVFGLEVVEGGAKNFDFHN